MGGSGFSEIPELGKIAVTAKAKQIGDIGWLKAAWNSLRDSGYKIHMHQQECRCCSAVAH